VEHPCVVLPGCSRNCGTTGDGCLLVLVAVSTDLFGGRGKWWPVSGGGLFAGMLLGPEATRGVVSGCGV
jgi:hypothetical protein